MRSARCLLVATALTGVALLSACGEESSSDLPAIEGADSSSSSADAEEGTNQQAGEKGIETSYPEVGLEITELPEPGKRAERAALRTLVDYEVAVMRTLTEAKVDPALRDLAAPSIVGRYEGSVDYQRQNNDLAYQGTRRLAVDTGAQGNRMTQYDVCIDLTDSYMVDGDGNRQDLNVNRVLSHVSLLPVGDSWRVINDEETEEPCH